MHPIFFKNYSKLSLGVNNPDIKGPNIKACMMIISVHNLIIIISLLQGLVNYF